MKTRWTITAAGKAYLAAEERRARFAASEREWKEAGKQSAITSLKTETIEAKGLSK